MPYHSSPSPAERDGARAVRDASPPAEPKTIILMRRIVAEGQYRRISGILVDVSTAQVVLTVFDGLSPRLRAKFAQMPVALMARTAWALVSRSGS